MMPGKLVPIFRRHVPTRWHEWGSANFPAMNKIVNRPWAEMCCVVDILVGAAIVVATLVQ